MRELIKEVRLLKPRNCSVQWKFNLVEYGSPIWSGIDWYLLSKYPKVEQLEKQIRKIENRVYSCAICEGTFKESRGIVNHHLIGGGSVKGVHPTGIRILDDVTIGVCNSCHGSYGSGWLHTITEQEQLIRDKYKDIVDKKIKIVDKLLHQIDKHSLMCEIKMVKSRLNDIRHKQDEYIKNKLKNEKKTRSKR